MSSPEVQGRHATFRDGKFLYEYQCGSCGEIFKDSAPSVVPPVVCHTCFSGTQRCRARGDNRRGATHAKSNNRRKAKHKSQWSE